MTVQPIVYKPRDIVRVFASVNRTLKDFFYDNSHLPITSETKKAATPPTETPSPSKSQSKDRILRPGVILDLTDDYATIAMFTTFRGKGLSEIKGFLRPISAAVLPLNHKPDTEIPSWMPTFTTYPTWRVPEPAKHSICLCIKHKVLVSKLEPWSWKDEPVATKERLVMCRDDFRLLLQLCEKNEGLRGLLASGSWLFEQLGLDD